LNKFSPGVPFVQQALKARMAEDDIPSGCLCFFYGLTAFSALTPKIPTIPLKIFACS